MGGDLNVDSLYPGASFVIEVDGYDAQLIVTVDAMGEDLCVDGVRVSRTRGKYISCGPTFEDYAAAYKKYISGKSNDLVLYVELCMGELYHELVGRFVSKAINLEEYGLSVLPLGIDVKKLLELRERFMWRG